VPQSDLFTPLLGVKNLSKIILSLLKRANLRYTQLSGKIIMYRNEVRRTVQRTVPIKVRINAAIHRPAITAIAEPVKTAWEIRVPAIQTHQLRKIINSQWTGLLVIFILFLIAAPAWSRQQSSPDMENMPGMNHGDMHAGPSAEDPAVVAERLKGKLQSEFNHHLAGMFLIIAGTFIIGEDRFAKIWPGLRYVWPICFLGAGIFLVFLSDMDVWPFGSLTPWYAVTHDVEDLQHKIFGIILLAIGYVEFQRTRGRFKGTWSAWFFPAAGIAGAVMLLFHVHAGDMNAPGAMETMKRVQREHLEFTVTGLGLSLSKGLGETQWKWKQAFTALWPCLLITMGIC
jgi:hypothetical protein